ncbi:MAG: single-stranded-DNA-specific exonuclease RecJ [Oscillospiraceae bacterium]|nr:single-stranded-DNA-specific exonuclease RecJ [Oscillospiraceae bacterium]
MKKWIIGAPDPAAVSTLQKGSDLSELCCAVLASQGCTSLEQASDRIGCRELSDPSLICDMQTAAEAILQAVESGKRICIYVDYDCDGVMATVILYSFLYETGADVTWRIPERAEGYGLNLQAVEEMHQDGVQLVVTVDNGISAIPEAKRMQELGMELVITDHHQPGDELPCALAVVDAHRTDNFSPFRLYCGAGIALLLVAAMNDGDVAMALEQFGDLAAVATIADIVSLTGENRYLVQIGLEYLQNTERPGLRALREVSGLSGKALTAGNVAFGIAPRINAAGRLASPRLAVELMLAEDPQQAQQLAEQINQLNTNRKTEGERILFHVREQIAQTPQLIHERVLVLSGEDWNAGIIGIAAARLQEKYGKPCFIISVKDGVGHGSARSFGEFSVFGCLTYCADLLEKYGGHPAAGGFTIKAEQIPAFRQRVAAYAAENHPQMPVMELRSACVLKRHLLVPEQISSLAQLEPFGTDNPEPLFAAENARITEIRPVSGGAHTKLTVTVDGVSCDAMLFRTDPQAAGLRVGDVVHLMAHVSVNSWMGKESITLNVQDFRTSGISQTRILSAMAAYDTYRRGEMLPASYYAAIAPSREECIAVYQAVPVKGIRIDRLTLAVYPKQINYCKMRICLDIFAELGLIAIEEGESYARRLPAKQTDLHQSEILKTVSSLAKEGIQHG